MRKLKTIIIPLIAASALTLSACTSDHSNDASTHSESGKETHSETVENLDMEFDNHGHMTGDGTSDTAGGYTLAVNEYDPDSSVIKFSIAKEDGSVLTDFKVKHEKPLHMLFVSENFGEYHHVHPEMDSEGFWTVDVPRSSGGNWAIYTDFATEELPDGVVLRSDLVFNGEVANYELPPPSSLIQTDDFLITAVGDMSADKHGSLTLTVLQDGTPVTFDKYLGEDAHLVALRVEDGAYAHFHPMGGHDHGDGSMDGHDHSQMGAPGVLMFETEVPGPGQYIMFLEFKTNGKMNLVPFTADIF
jgi:hypothetical protein